MAIQFPCSNCGALIEVDDHYAGGQCECPACNATVGIPRESTAGPAAPVAPTAPPPPPPSPSAPQPQSPAPMPRMSPPTMPGMIQPPVDPGRKGWAIAAFVLGTLSFCVPILPLLAVPFGIIALILITNNPGKYGGKGLAIAGIIVSGAALAIWAVLFSIALPSLARARELSKRSVCAANLKGIGTGFYTSDLLGNEGSWPSPFFHHEELIPPGGVDYVGAIGSYRGKTGDPDAGDIIKMRPVPDKLSNTRSLWMMVRLQISTPKSHVCPSSNDSPNMDTSPQNYWDFGVGDITGPANPGQVRQGWDQVSYGYQVPFGNYGRPGSDCDMRMPLAADKGPFGAALDAGLANPPPITVHGNSPPDQWRRWNSPNHGGQGLGEGQNVLYADGHVDWAKTPIVGMGSDNIYTQWSGRDALGQIQGNRPTAGGKQTPAGATDTLIYP